MFAFLRELIGIPSVKLPEMGFTEMLDIAIVAVLIYYILGWIRKTRAWSLLKGIVVIMLLAALASAFNLITVSWVVQNAFGMGMVALVILFQPELRRAFEQLGKKSYLAGLTQYGDSKKNVRISEQAVNGIVSAVKQMADDRTGALICIERDTPLKEHENTGIIIDSAVSSQLLLNIFTDKTPLHDGAVIIRDSRIAAATCILPLTSEEIGHDLGTRHRAAVGLSEVSDALVIVVSEETGTLSVAIGGKLRRHMTEKHLRELLMTNNSDVRRRLVLWKKQRKSH